MTSKKLGEAIINGKAVSFFTPPHDEPDFMWVDMEELARAFLSKKWAKRMTADAPSFGKGKRMIATARNGDRIATIICHAMAQGLCGFIDFKNGHSRDESGPAHVEYCYKAADFGNEHYPMEIDQVFAAFKNNGGPFMRGAFEGEAST